MRAQDALVRRLRSIEYRINVLEAWDGEMPASRDQYIMPAWTAGTGVVTTHGNMPVVELIDGASRTVLFSFSPTDRFTSFTDLMLCWVSAAAAGDLLWEMNADFGSVGEAYNTHNVIAAAGASATLGADIVNESIHPLGFDMSALNSSDRVGVTVTRRADLAGDTLGASVYVLALLMNSQGNV